MIWSGDLSDFTVVYNSGTDTFTITDTDTGDGLDEGTDTVTGVETFRFNGVDYTHAQMVTEAERQANTAPGSPSVASGGSVPENSAAGTVVATLTATDADGDPLTYTITDSGGNPISDSNFEIVGNEIRVKSGADIDYESTTSHTLYLTASDAFETSAPQSVAITVTDVAENLVLGDGGVTFTDTGVTELSITGGAADDTITGSAGDDTISGGGSYDTIIGGDGNDTLMGDGGEDTLYGGDGEDIIDGGADSDEIYGGAGNDTINDTGGTNSQDELYGGAGDDIINAGSGWDLITGGAGDDTIDGGAGTDTAIWSGDFSDFSISYDSGTDTFTITDNDTADGLDEGTDTVTKVENFEFNGVTYTHAQMVTEAARQANTAPTDIAFASGGSVNETVADGGTIGSAYDPSGSTVGTLATTDANAGDSHTYSLVSDPSGKFEIVGNEIRVKSGQTIDYETDTSFNVTVRTTDQFGATHDEVLTINVTDYEGSYTITNAAGETVTGTSEEDRIYGGDGLDTVYGGDGDDTITGWADNDIIYGGDGDDDIFGEHGDDIVYGGAGEDYIGGSVGDDTFYGGDDNDTIGGGSDDDNLYGGAGDDDLSGHGDEDLLEGGAGDDTIDGGTGNDIAVFSGNWSDYTITESGGTYTVVDNRPGSPDGTDTVTNVETFRFADGDVAEANLINAAPTDITFDVNSGITLNDDGGNNAYLYATDSGDIVGGLSAMTIEVQFSSSRSLGNYEYTNLFSYHAGGASDEIEIGIEENESGIELYIEIGGQPTIVPNYDATTLLDGGEHQISLTWDNSAGNWEIFVDGVSVSSGTGIAAGHTIASGGMIVLGQEQDSLGGGFDPAQNFQGTYHDVRIFNDVRTAQEISDNAMTEVSSSEAGLVADWRMDDLAGGSTADAVSGNNLTVGNVTGAGWATSTPKQVAHVAENASVGTVVTTLNTVDANPGDSFSYVITNDPSGFFEIVGTEVRVKAGANIDYETATNHDITIEITDSGGNTYSEVVTVNVNNINEAPTDLSLSYKETSETQVNTETTSTQSDPAVAELSDGGYVVTWTSSGDQDGDSLGVFGQRFDANGDPFGGEFQVNTTTASAQLQPEIAGLSNGGFVVTWSGIGADTSYDIYAQAYDSSGNTVGGEVLVNTTATDHQLDPVITGLQNGGYVIAWRGTSDGSSYGIHMQRFDASGNPEGGETQVNSYTTSFQSAPDITTLADGSYVVIWQSYQQDGDGQGVYGQHFASNGTPIGTEFQVNATTTGSQYYPSIASLEDGGFVVTWYDSNNDDIKAQRFDANADTVGSEITVNTTTANIQHEAEVTGLADGGFMITWTSETQDGDSGGIYGQRFDANGNTVDPEFQVNSVTAGDQEVSSIATLSDGRVVVAWETNDAHLGGITHQIYNPNHPVTETVTNGTLVAKVSAVDPDAVDSFTYNLTDDAGGRFAIESDTGEITVADASLLDYETATSHNVTVQVTDAGGNSYSEVITINVADGPEHIQLADGDTNFTDTGVAETSITGGSGNDTITAHNDGGVIDGADGNDNLTGGNSADTIEGGSGNDVIYGGAGDDTIYGDTNTDDGGGGSLVVDALSFTSIDSGASTASNLSDVQVGQYAVYQNVGTAEDGTVIGARLYLDGKSNGSSRIEFRDTSSATVYVSDAAGSADVRIEYFDQATGLPVQITSSFTFKDIDSAGNESITIEKDDAQSLSPCDQHQLCG